MTIFRSNKTGKLVLLFLASPRMYTGSWYEEVDYFTGKLNKKHVELKNYTAVAHC